MFERSQAARRSARAKILELLGQERAKLSKRTLLQRQRAAQKAIEEALAKTHSERNAWEIAFNLSQCFEAAEFLVALQFDAKRFSKAEIETGVSDVLDMLDNIWEAARLAGYPLPCLEEEVLHYDDEDIEPRRRRLHHE
ncbi:MAG TPA: hypothetical protein VEG60_12650 [Candidatus Binatia bacterium]|nr:hypothetical protein [Candidatus Binatia bacterium]